MLRREVPVAVAFISGAVVLIAYFLPDRAINQFSQDILLWRAIVAAFALGLGAVNLINITTRRLRVQRGGRVPNVLLLVCLIGYSLLGVFLGSQHTMYRYIYNNIYTAASSTVFSLNAFFIASAAYRSFRVKNIQAIIFFVSGFLVLIGQVGIGAAIWSGFPRVAQWIMAVPNTAVMRAIVIGAALGTISTSIRVLIGAERASFGAE
jgi:hypothetical protein